MYILTPTYSNFNKNLKINFQVHISFDKGDDGEWRVRSAVCVKCQAGKNCGYCHHIVIGLEGLFALTRGWVLAGEVNGGKMHWGLRQSNDVRAKVPTQKLCVLAGLECLVTFSGCCKLRYEPVMLKFNQKLEESQPMSAPLIMTQQLYGTPDGEARPSTATVVRVKRGFKHDPEARLRGKRRRLLFAAVAKDSRPRKPTTFEEAITFAQSVSVSVGRRTTLRSVLYLLKSHGYKW